MQGQYGGRSGGRARQGAALLLLLAAAAPPLPPAPRSPACPPAGELPALTLPRTRAAYATNQPIIVAALGSSSTRGWMAIDIAHAYPSELQRLLAERVPRSAISVINRGVGGQDAPEELARLDIDVLALRPTLVIWQVGANGAIRAAAPNTFRRLLVEGIRKIRAAGADVVLMDNQRSPRILAAPDHAAMEEALRDVASTAGVGLFPRGLLMDHWAGAGAPYDDFVAPDGLHMNTRGYECLADALANQIAAALGSPPHG